VDAAEELLRRRLARRSLIEYCRYTWPEYETPPHIRLLAETLEAVERGEITRLIVSMPPRHGKSQLVSVAFPCWYLGRHPERSIVQAGYGESIALVHSRRARDLFVGHEMAALFPEVRYRPERAGQESVIPQRQAAHEWGTVQGGSYYAVGVGGGLTGRGFDLGIVDDATKDAAEASSALIRENTDTWYRTAFRTRAAPNAAIIIVMTRWHEADLVGRVTGREGEGWHVLRLPALAEDNDPLGRAEGEALWPERYPRHELERVREEEGPYYWASLYQQRPQSEGGNIFKAEWWRWHDVLPVSQLTVQVWDTAFKDKATSDYSACVTLAKHATGVAVVDVWRERVEFPDLVRAVKTQAEKHHPDLVAVEDAASGQPLIQVLRRDTDLAIVGITPQGDKTQRARRVTGICEAGRVSLPRQAPWLHMFLDELGGFPKAAHDDIVDAFVHGLSRCWQPELKLDDATKNEPQSRPAFAGVRKREF
jgi:predicted phage terminase large subunit-like protein